MNRTTTNASADGYEYMGIGQIVQPARSCAARRGEKVALVMDEFANVGFDYGGGPGFVVRCSRCGEMKPPVYHEVFKTADGKVAPFTRTYCADCCPVVAMNIYPRTIGPRRLLPDIRPIVECLDCGSRFRWTASPDVCICGAPLHDGLASLPLILWDVLSRYVTCRPLRRFW